MMCCRCLINNLLYPHLLFNKHNTPSPSMSDPSLSVSDDGCENTENNQKLLAQKLFNQISRAIAVATKHQLLTYERINPKTGSLVTSSLDEDGEVEAVGHR